MILRPWRSIFLCWTTPFWRYGLLDLLNAMYKVDIYGALISQKGCNDSIKMEWHAWLVWYYVLCYWDDLNSWWRSLCICETQLTLASCIQLVYSLLEATGWILAGKPVWLFGCKVLFELHHTIIEAVMPCLFKTIACPNRDSLHALDTWWEVTDF